MPNRVHFSNKSGQALLVERAENNNLVDYTTEAFNNDFDGNPKLGLIDFYGMLFPNGDTSLKPFMYFRHTDTFKNTCRFANLLDFGDDFLSVQKGAFHADEIASTDTPLIPYSALSKSPLTYGFGAQEKRMKCVFSGEGAQVEEGNFFKMKAIPWTNTFYDHQSVYKNASTIFQPSTYMGTLDGKPVLGLGNYDRMFFKQDAGGFDNVPLEYISSCLLGIREDGRKEHCFVSASINDVGKVIASYSIEGEPTIITDQVTIEANWYHLPYVDDGTCVFKDVTYYFCGKTVHFNGRWGAKGFTTKPRVEKHGQSQVFGTWYEGEKSYKHRIYSAFVENMGVYDNKLKELGFEIIK